MNTLLLCVLGHMGVLCVQIIIQDIDVPEILVHDGKELVLRKKNEFR